ncbi:Dirigent domain-containing protein [Cephalotus follicularis]|uniref:Dirigent protein n=1 Tax=Cephalotus follicularis TaxID=3775 RepID=A0A1Q3CKA1_CEPFO|nr:Dirigent domain-containing protein [Cephalotus follicularis]
MEGKLIQLIWVLFLFIAMTAPAHSHYSFTSVPNVSPTEKVTNLHFFYHDSLTGKNPTGVLVAKPNNSDPSLAPFGAVFAVNDPLTVGPELTSEVIGNARGIYVSSAVKPEQPMVMMYLDFGFTSGEFNGSSISMFSRNPVQEKERELAVVGGRGKFRMARGYALLNTFFVDPKGAVIVEYTVTVFHY